MRDQSSCKFDLRYAEMGARESIEAQRQSNSTISRALTLYRTGRKNLKRIAWKLVPPYASKRHPNEECSE